MTPATYIAGFVGFDIGLAVTLLVAMRMAHTFRRTNERVLAGWREGFG